MIAHVGNLKIECRFILLVFVGVISAMPTSSLCNPYQRREDPQDPLVLERKALEEERLHTQKNNYSKNNQDEYERLRLERERLQVEEMRDRKAKEERYRQERMDLSRLPYTIYLEENQRRNQVEDSNRRRLQQEINNQPPITWR